MHNTPKRLTAEDRNTPKQLSLECDPRRRKSLAKAWTPGGLGLTADASALKLNAWWPHWDTDRAATNIKTSRAGYLQLCSGETRRAKGLGMTVAPCCPTWTHGLKPALKSILGRLVVIALDLAR